MTYTGDHRFNVFVPSFAPQFKAMQEAGGRPGVSLENQGRGGVWVPLEWLDHVSRPGAKWVPFSAEQLQAIYGREQPKPIDQP